MTFDRAIYTVVPIGIQRGVSTIDDIDQEGEGRPAARDARAADSAVIAFRPTGPSLFSVSNPTDQNSHKYSGGYDQMSEQATLPENRFVIGEADRRQLPG